MPHPFSEIVHFMKSYPFHKIDTRYSHSVIFLTKWHANL